MNVLLFCSFCACRALALVRDRKSHHQKFLDDLKLTQYERNLAQPASIGVPVAVELLVKFYEMSDVSYPEMTYSIDIMLYERWRDSRLSHKHGEGLVFNNSRFLWVPGSYLVSMKQADNAQTSQGVSVHIGEDGTVTKTTRTTLIGRCPSDFSNFPFDVQKCVVSLSSYGYTSSEVEYQHWRWIGFMNSTLLKKTPSMQIVSTGSWKAKQEFASAGIFDEVNFLVCMRRNTANFAFTCYFRSNIAVILSWLPFYIDRVNLTARISVGILTMLFFNGVVAGVVDNMQTIKNFKAIDHWVIMCSLYLVVAVFQSVVVHRCDHHHAERAERLSAMKLGDWKSNSDGDSTGGSGMSRGFRRLGSAQNKVFDKIYTSGKRIDLLARILFPATFLLYQIGYWKLYLPSYLNVRATCTPTDANDTLPRLNYVKSTIPYFFKDLHPPYRNPVCM